VQPTGTLFGLGIFRLHTLRKQVNLAFLESCYVFSMLIMYFILAIKSLTLTLSLTLLTKLPFVAVLISTSVHDVGKRNHQRHTHY